MIFPNFLLSGVLRSAGSEVVPSSPTLLLTCKGVTLASYFTFLCPFLCEAEMILAPEPRGGVHITWDNTWKPLAQWSAQWVLTITSTLFFAVEKSWNQFSCYLLYPQLLIKWLVILGTLLWSVSSSKDRILCRNQLQPYLKSPPCLVIVLDTGRKMNKIQALSSKTWK